jgi:hypothetical protein
VGKLEPRSHGGLRLSGDLPGRSKNRWRVLGFIFIYLPREEDVSGCRVDSLSSTRGDRVKPDVVARLCASKRQGDCQTSRQELTWSEGLGS